MTIGSVDVLAVLQRLFDGNESALRAAPLFESVTEVPDDAEDVDVVGARLRNFQHRGFPISAALGRGKVVRYGAADLVKLALAFELITGFMSPMEAMDMIGRSWEVLEPFLKGVWLERDGGTHARPLLIRGSGVTGRRRTRGTIMPADAVVLRDWLQGGGGLKVVTVVDARRVLIALSEALDAIAPEQRRQGIRSALDEWASETRPAG